MQPEPEPEVASFLNMQESDPEDFDGSSRTDSPVLGARARRSGDVDPLSTRRTPRIEVNSPRSPENCESSSTSPRKTKRPSLTLDLTARPGTKASTASVKQHQKQDSVAASIVTTTSEEYVTPATDAKYLEDEVRSSAS